MSSFEPTTEQLYQKQYCNFGITTLTKKQTIVIYNVDTVSTESIDD